MKKKDIYAIAGPTASGKSSLALALAEQMGCEIVSMDSMQIYKGMDIGTAKPIREETERVKHHMIDICEPHEKFSCAAYVREAEKCVEDIISRGKHPLFVGGTGLYLDGLIYPHSYEESDRVPEYRTELQRILDSEGADALYEMLRKADPESAEIIHPNNVKRVMRALEIYHETGMPKSVADAQSREKDGKYNVHIAILEFSDRAALYKRIDDRVDIMISDGLVEETERLYKEGALSEGTTAAAAIGYKEILPYVKGECSLAEATDVLKRATRRYAKRQITWFSRYKDAVRLQMDSGKDFKYFVNFLANTFF